jgi:ABC-type branched-subunit amino acid transport system substrate-binding protein
VRTPIATERASGREIRQTVAVSKLRNILIASTLIALTACSNRGDEASTTSAAPTDSAPTDSAAPSTDAPTADAITFGDVPSPCGPAPDGVTPTVAEGEGGGATDVIRIAAASDKGNVAVPGLNAELYDATAAFAGWCNEQGGIAGLPLEVIDADAKLFEVPAQMENVCTNAFAMVGGGWAFDDQEFPRFHECDMIDFAGFTVSAAKSSSDNLVSAMPNPSDRKDAGWFKWATAVYPESMTAFATVFSDITTAQIVEQQYIEAAEIVGGVTTVERITYNSLGETSWVPIAQKLKSAGARAVAFVGVPEVLALLTKAMDEIGYRPDLIMADAGFYAEVLVERGGASVDGVVIRTAFTLLEEADRVKAVRDYVDMVNTHTTDGKISGLGMQAASASLLFASAARDCIEAEGVLSRACVMEAAKSYTTWTGGGLHAPSQAGRGIPSPCYQMITVKDGAFTRLYPPIEPTDADRAIVDTVEITADGWACDESTLVDLVGDYGDTTAGKRPS